MVVVVERTFTEAEANALLPRLIDLLGKLQQAHARLRDALRTARRHVASNGSAPAPASSDDDEQERLLDEITELGVIVRDPESGLCDFPAMRDGEEVFLCWRLGEDRVGFWHPRDTGIAGRQQL